MSDNPVHHTKRDASKLTTLDDWLHEENILEEVTQTAKKRVEEIHDNSDNQIISTP